MGCILALLYLICFPITIFAAIVYVIICWIFGAPYSFAEVWGVTFLVLAVADLLKRIP